MTGGIVLCAGRDSSPPPAPVLRTMARECGGGGELLARYREHCRKQQSVAAGR